MGCSAWCKRNCHTICGLRIRKFILVCLAAVFFTAAWMLQLDLELSLPDYMYLHPLFRAPISIGTASFLLMNMFGKPDTGESHDAHATPPATKKKRRICTPMLRIFCMLAGFVLAICAVSCAIFLWVTHFLLKPWLCQWPGYYMLAQALFIFTSNIIMKFGTREKKTVDKNVGGEEWDYHNFCFTYIYPTFLVYCCKKFWKCANIPP